MVEGRAVVSRLLYSSCVLALALLLFAPQVRAVEAKAEAHQLVQEVTSVVRKMTEDAVLAGLLARSKGVFVVPHFGGGAFVTGARGGPGIMLAHDDGKWSEPVFYNIGALGGTPEARDEGGPVAFLLMSPHGLNSFRSGTNFSIDVGAEFVVVDYSKAPPSALADSDIILWSETEGDYAGAAVGAIEIMVNDAGNSAFYDREIEPQTIIAGHVQPQPAAAPLKRALPG